MAMDPRIGVTPPKMREWPVLMIAELSHTSPRGQALGLSVDNTLPPEPQTTTLLASVLPIQKGLLSCLMFLNCLVFSPGVSGNSSRFRI